MNLRAAVIALLSCKLHEIARGGGGGSDGAAGVCADRFFMAVAFSMHSQLHFARAHAGATLWDGIPLRVADKSDPTSAFR